MALLHTEPLPQRSLCTEQFYTLQIFYAGKRLTQRNLYTQRLHKKFLQTETFARRNFTQSSFYTAYFFPHRNLYAQKQSYSAQKSYAQKVFFLHTDAFTHRCLYTDTTFTHRNLCTQHAFNTVNFYTESLCFPFLITYLSCSSSQVMIAFCWENDGVTAGY